MRGGGCVMAAGGMDAPVGPVPIMNGRL